LAGGLLVQAPRIALTEAELMGNCLPFRSLEERGLLIFLGEAGCAREQVAECVGARVVLGAVGLVVAR